VKKLRGNYKKDYGLGGSGPKGISIPASAADIFQTIIIAISLCVILYVFIVTPNEVEGESMYPTFSNAEVVLTSKLNNWLGRTDFGKSLGLDYKRGDSVVLQKPGDKDYIKRIIALPGERIAIRDGYVYINNNRLTENYLPPATYTQGGEFLEDGGEGKVVPENTYFVLGDNRTQSFDSRFNELGFVKESWLKGKVVLRSWPIDKFGLINAGEYKLDI
jgi:signal peptidase I